jgi:hypothetical protein
MSDKLEVERAPEMSLVREINRRYVEAARTYLLIMIIIGGCILTIAWTGFLLWLPVHAIGLW